MAFRGTFNAGYPDGEHLFYYENGRLREIQNYKAGVKHGDWKKYLDTGELYFTITYDQGKEVKYDGEALDENDVIKEWKSFMIFSLIQIIAFSNKLSNS